MVAQAKDAHPRRHPAPKRKQQMAAALISAAVTITVTFIGVLPKLWNKDSKIDDLEQQVAQLKQQAGAAGDSKEKGPAAKRLLIGGMVLDLTGKRPLGRAEVYLIPLSNPKLMAKTDDTGGFKFKEIPDQPYWIVVRDPKRGSSSAGFIDEDNNEATFEGAVVKYRVER